MEGAEPKYVFGEIGGVLLIHDLAGSPNQLQGLADVLSSAGFSVDVPLLPGHGTNLDDLDHMSWDDWAAAAQLAIDELASRAGSVVVGGIGLGATLACYVAASHPAAQGVIAINPRAIPVPQQAIDTLESMLKDGATNVPPLGPDISDKRVRVVEYNTVPVKTLISMFEAIEGFSEHWGELDCPVLIITSARDHRVSPENANWLAARLGGDVERVTLENSFHLATMDVDHIELEQTAVSFARRVMQTIVLD